VRLWVSLSTSQERLHENNLWLLEKESSNCKVRKRSVKIVDTRRFFCSRVSWSKWSGNRDLVSHAYITIPLPFAVPKPLLVVNKTPTVQSSSAQTASAQRSRLRLHHNNDRQHNAFNMPTTHLSDDESAQWVRFTLGKPTHLAISARLVGPGALDAIGLLRDERLCRDLVSICVRVKLRCWDDVVSFVSKSCDVNNDVVLDDEGEMFLIMKLL